jgi:hypothetical protein
MHLYTYVNKRFHDVMFFFLVNIRKKIATHAHHYYHKEKKKKKREKEGEREKKPTGRRNEGINRESSRR